MVTSAATLVATTRAHPLAMPKPSTRPHPDGNAAETPSPARDVIAAAATTSVPDQPLRERPLSMLRTEPLGRAPTIEELVESAVQRAVQRTIGPYLTRLCDPEPAVYTVAQAAVVLQVSEDTVSRMVKRGVLARVPHLDGKVLIPRAAVGQLINGQPTGCPSDPPRRHRSRE